MQQTATRFETTDNAIQGMLKALMNELTPLQTAFVGAAGTSFAQVSQRWNEDVMKMSRALRETAEAIRTSGQQYDASDASSQNRITSAGSSLPL